MYKVGRYPLPLPTNIPDAHSTGAPARHLNLQQPPCPIISMAQASTHTGAWRLASQTQHHMTSGWPSAMYSGPCLYGMQTLPHHPPRNPQVPTQTWPLLATCTPMLEPENLYKTHAHSPTHAAYAAMSPAPPTMRCPLIQGRCLLPRACPALTDPPPRPPSAKGSAASTTTTTCPPTDPMPSHPPTEGHSSVSTTNTRCPTC